MCSFPSEEGSPSRIDKEWQKPSAITVRGDSLGHGSSTASRLSDGLWRSFRLGGDDCWHFMYYMSNLVEGRRGASSPHFDWHEGMRGALDPRRVAGVEEVGSSEVGHKYGRHCFLCELLEVSSLVRLVGRWQVGG